MITQIKHQIAHCIERYCLRKPTRIDRTVIRTHVKAYDKFVLLTVNGHQLPNPVAVLAWRGWGFAVFIAGMTDEPANSASFTMSLRFGRVRMDEVPEEMIGTVFHPEWAEIKRIPCQHVWVNCCSTQYASTGGVFENRTTALRYRRCERCGAEEGRQK